MASRAEPSSVRGAGSTPPAWRYGVFTAVLLLHAMALVGMRYVDIADGGRDDSPGVPLISGVTLERPQPPADPEPTVAPQPLPMKPKPAPRGRHRLLLVVF